MSGRVCSTIALVAIGASAPGMAAQPGRTYAVETGVRGVVDLYDLSGVIHEPGGFGIVEVAASRQFPHVFGPVAYRVNRETYHCGKGTYEISSVEEFRQDGSKIDSLPGQSRDAMRVVAHTADSEMYNRFCPAGSEGEVAGLTPVRIVRAPSRFAAYRIGRAMLGPVSP